MWMATCWPRSWCVAAQCKSVAVIVAHRALGQDPTGTIHGTIHRRVMEEHGADLGAGASLVLRRVRARLSPTAFRFLVSDALLTQVSLFSPNGSTRYLIVTPNNVVRVFPASTPAPAHALAVVEAAMGAASADVGAAHAVTDAFRMPGAAGTAPGGGAVVAAFGGGGVGGGGGGGGSGGGGGGTDGADSRTLAEREGGSSAMMADAYVELNRAVLLQHMLRVTVVRYVRDDTARTPACCVLPRTRCVLTLCGAQGSETAGVVAEHILTSGGVSARQVRYTVRHVACCRPASCASSCTVRCHASTPCRCQSCKSFWDCYR